MCDCMLWFDEKDVLATHISLFNNDQLTGPSVTRIVRSYVWFMSAIFAKQPAKLDATSRGRDNSPHRFLTGKSSLETMFLQRLSENEATTPWNPRRPRFQLYDCSRWTTRLSPAAIRDSTHCCYTVIPFLSHIYPVWTRTQLDSVKALGELQCSNWNLFSADGAVDL